MTRSRHVAAALLAAWGLFFLPQWLSDGVPFVRDTLFLHIPIRTFIQQRLRELSLPQWYPYDGLGAPLLGQMVEGLFHPLTWLLLPFPAPTAIKLQTLLCYLFALVGAYRFARTQSSTPLAAVTAAVGFSFTGYALGMSNNLTYLGGLATLPWVADAALRAARRCRPRDVALLAATLALLFLSGDFQSFVLCPLILLVAVLRHEQGLKRAMVAVSCGGLLSLLLVGVSLVPALSLAGQSSRAFGGELASGGRAWALQLTRLPELFIPGFVPDAVRPRVVFDLLGGSVGLWSPSIFAGGTVLLLLAFGASRASRGNVGFLVLSLLAFWLALGPAAGLLPLVWKLAPLLSKFRYPEKYLSLALLAAIPIVAAGVDRLRERPILGIRAASGAAAMLGAAAFVVSWLEVVPRVWQRVGRPLAAGDPLAPVLREAWSTGLLTTGAFLGLVALLVWLAYRRPLVWLGLPVLVLLELWNGNASWLPLVGREAIEDPGPFAAHVAASARGAAPADRVVLLAELPIIAGVNGTNEDWVRGSRLLIRPNTGALAGVSAFGGASLPGDSYRQALVSREPTPRLGALFNACFRIERMSAPLGPGDVVLSPVPELGVRLAQQECRPRAYLSATRKVPDFWAAREALGSLATGTSVWEGGPELQAAEGRVEWRDYRPELLRLEVEAKAATALVVSELYSPGWCASVDGVPTTIYPANLAVRGIVVPEGRHLVEMRYVKPGFRAGALMTGSGLALLLGLLVAPRLRRAGRQAPRADALS